MDLLSPDTIRRCLIADPGHHIISADFDQIELRVAAALAKEPVLIEAAKRGDSLHLATANKIFGVDHTPEQYRFTKNLNFGWLFSGGPETLSRQTGVPVDECRKLLMQYDNEMTALTEYKKRITQKVYTDALTPEELTIYKGYKAELYYLRKDTLSGLAARKQLQRSIQALLRNKRAYVITPFGRKLRVDVDRAYSAVNYIVQSAARDIMGQALLRIRDNPRLRTTMLLPIHDELLGQAPIKYAEKYAKLYGDIMSTTFYGVPITAQGKVYGPSWGDGYVR